MSFEKYFEKIKGDTRQAIKVEWLNPDESVNFEFTNSLYDIGVDLNVNYQNGSRRTCTLTLNNDKNQFPINFNNIWIGQKFKLWMGIYIDDKTPYYFPQGVFYISNPEDVYNPTTKTVEINGVDKWAFLDGTLHGKLSGIYTTNIGVNLYDATRELLLLPRVPTTVVITDNNIGRYFYISNGDYCFEYDGSSFTSNNKDVHKSDARTVLTARMDMHISFGYTYSSESDCDKFTLKVGEVVVENEVSGRTTSRTFNGSILRGQEIIFEYSKDGTVSGYNDQCRFYNLTVNPTAAPDNVVDPIPPKLSPAFLDKKVTVPVLNESTGEYVYEEKDVLSCPYTATVQRGNSYADVLLEYATILCAHIYYDVNGRLVIEPMADNADDITDTDKEVLWNYTVDEKVFLGLTQKYNFDKVYNDIIVLGNVVNGYQFKARVQNRNLMSDTCVQKIGLKTKEPFEDNQYYSDLQCKELAMYYAKIYTIMQKSGTIESVLLYHLDVNKLVSVSTPNNNMSKELFLVSGFSISSSGTMSISVTSVNILKGFSVVEAEVYA